MTGGIPIAGAVRRLDRLTLGDGLLFPGGTPGRRRRGRCGDLGTELSGQGNFQMQTLAAQVAVRPNAAVRKVAIVQAPADGRKLVADRQSVVQATIDAMINGPEMLEATTTVIATASDGSDRGPRAGNNRATHLQARPQRRAAPCRIDVRPGRGRDGDGDRRGVRSDRRQSLRRRRQPREHGDDGTGSGRESAAPCHLRERRRRRSECVVPDRQRNRERMADYAAEAMPLDAVGIQVGLFCGLRPALTHDEPGVLNGLALLDEQARRERRATSPCWSSRRDG